MFTTKLRAAAFAALLATGAAATAQAGVIEFQGVTFTTSFTGNVLTLEMDAAHPSGDWLTATTIGAIELKDLGNFTTVSLTSAPGAASAWLYSSNELNANGCTGGSHSGSNLCYSGAHVALTDDMIFKFTFTGGTQDFSSPQLKLNLFVGNGEQKVGSLGSLNIPAVPEPETYGMMLAGLGILAAFTRLRKSA